MNRIEFALPPNHSEVFSKAENIAKMIKSERLKDYMVHLHITPGLIEDYTPLVENISKRSENYSSRFFFTNFRL